MDGISAPRWQLLDPPAGPDGVRWSLRWLRTWAPDRHAVYWDRHVRNWWRASRERGLHPRISIAEPRSDASAERRREWQEFIAVTLNNLPDPDLADVAREASTAVAQFPDPWPLGSDQPGNREKAERLVRRESVGIALTLTRDPRQYPPETPVEKPQVVRRVGWSVDAPHPGVQCLAEILVRWRYQDDPERPDDWRYPYAPGDPSAPELSREEMERRYRIQRMHEATSYPERRRHAEAAGVDMPSTRLHEPGLTSLSDEELVEVCEEGARLVEAMRDAGNSYREVADRFWYVLPREGEQAFLPLRGRRTTSTLGRDLVLLRLGEDPDDEQGWRRAKAALRQRLSRADA